MTTRILLFLFLLMGVSLSAQPLLNELERLDTISDTDEHARIIAKLLIRFLPGEQPASGADLLAAYTDNPYLSNLLQEESIRQQILALSMEGLSEEVKAEDKGNGRLAYRQVDNHIELFQEERDLDLGWLKEEYAKPASIAMDQLQEKSQRAQISVGSTTDYVSMLMAGLSDWIKKRAQEEFTLTFMDRLNKKIQQEKLQHLFPATAKLLKHASVTEYRSLLPEARVAFARDLQSISFNFAGFLRASGAIDDNDSRLHTLLLIYELMDLSARGFELPEIIGYARGQINDRRFAAEQRIHLDLSSELQEETTPATELLAQYQQVVVAYRNEGIRLKDSAQIISARARDLRNNPEVDEADKAYLRAITRSDFVTNSSFETLFDDENRHFGQAEDLLRGRPPYTYWLANPSLQTFTTYFLNDSLPGPDTLRAMGLTMLRAFLNRSPTGEFRVFERLGRMADSLQTWKDYCDALTLSIAPVEVSEEQVTGKMEELQRKIVASGSFWRSNLPEQEARDSAFVYLNRLAQAYITQGSAVRGTDRFLLQLDYLSEVDSQYRNYIAKLENNTTLQDPNTFRTTIKPPPLRSELKGLELQFADLEHTYHSFRAEAAAGNLQSYRNAQYYEQMLGLSAELFYFLSYPKEDTTSKVSALVSNLIKPDIRRLYQGLLYQRLSNQSPFGLSFSTDGLVALGTDFSIAFADLRENNPKDSLTNKFGRYLDFLTTVINQVLETPLLNTGNGVISLSSYPDLRSVPDINRRINEIYGLTSGGQYRQAIVPLLDLITLFNIIPGDPRNLAIIEGKIDRQTKKLNRFQMLPALSEQQKQDSLAAKVRLEKLQKKQGRMSTASVRRFRQYVRFGAGLAAAERPEDIQAVLNTAALPPGSSRNKRLYRFNVDLNAYFGGAYGQEFLLDTPDSLSRSATTFGLFVPVGATLSWKIWPRREWSASLFIPIIDLGAITAYRSGENADIIPKVTFRNLLAPGAHLFINIPRSPFFIGAGIQYGPNERTIGEQTYSAYRKLLTFGIDVPIVNFARSEY